VSLSKLGAAGLTNAASKSTWVVVDGPWKMRSSGGAFLHPSGYNGRWPPYSTDVLRPARTSRAWFDDDVQADDDLTYVSLQCPACARIHLVNRMGKTPADDNWSC
jgi:hypothetical protein